MLSDPNWLLSTIVQASATVVAIVGGFIVSQAINTTGEISNFESKLRELNLELSQRTETIDSLRDERVRKVVESFVDEMTGSELFEVGSVTSQELLDSFQKLTGQNFSDDEKFALDAAGNGLIESYDSASQALSNRLGPTGIPTPTPDGLDALGLEVPEDKRRIYLHTLRLLRTRGIEAGSLVVPESPYRGNEAMRNFGAIQESMNARSLGMRLIQPLPTTRPHKSETELAIEIAALQSRIELVNNELDIRMQRARPKGLLVFLLYMSATGIVFPTILMALRPVPEQAFVRVLLVFFLVVGLALFAIIFTKAVPRHSRDRTS